MIVLSDVPPAHVCAAPIPSRNIMIWGDTGARKALLLMFEKKGWKWAMLVLGEQSEALLLIPPATVSDIQITDVINKVNAGEYGKLNAGYGQIGNPDTLKRSTTN